MCTITSASSRHRPDGPTPFIVTGNGGYHNLHAVHSEPGDKAPDTGAVLKYATENAGVS